jgi:ferritin
MLSQKLQDALNKQMTAEFYSAYLYLQMAAYYESEDLPGFANFFRIQHQEELQHAMKFFDFLCEIGVKPSLGTIETSRNDFSSAKEPFDASLEHEKKVTASIGNLVDIANEEKAHAANAFLQWFVTEQVEEEATFSLYIRKLEMAGDDARGLLMLDQELGQRALGPAE